MIRRICLCAAVLMLAAACDSVTSNEVNLVGTTLVCKPGSMHCNGDVLERCRDQGYGFVPVETCALGCNLSSNACNASCRPKDKKCVDDQLWTCFSDGTGYSKTTCAKGCNAERNACFETCNPGETRCNGDKLQTCFDDGSGFGETECKFGCNKSSGSQSCNEICRPGSQRCNGTKLATCNSDGKSFSESECENGCNPARLACNGGLTADAGSDQTIVISETATLNASATSGAGNYTYSWSDGTDVIGTTASVNVTPSQTTTYTVTVTDAQGNVDSDQVTVTVNPRLVADAGEDRRVVRGTVVTFEGTATGGIGSISCNWYAGTALVSDTCSYSVAVVENTVFVLIVGDSKGHLSQDSVLITVTDPLSVTAGADLFVTSGTEVTLSANADSGQPISCSWAKTNEPATVVSTDCTYKPTVSETTSFTVTATDDFGETATDEVVVNVLTVTAQADKTRVIKGQDVSFSVIVAGNQGSVTCAWSNDVNGDTSDSCDMTYAFSDEGNVTFTVRVTDTGNGNTVEGTVMLELFDPLNVDAGDTLHVMTGTEVGLDASVMGGVGTPSCSWTIVGSSDPAIIGCQATFTPAAAGTYELKLEVTDEEGNTATDSMTIYAQDAPLSVDAGSDAYIESGGSATLTATPANGVPPYASCSWVVKGSATVVSDQCSFAPTNVTDTTTYVVTATDDAGNTATDEVTLFVLKANAGNDASVPEAGSITLNGTATGASGSITCKWTLQDGTEVSTECAPTLSPSGTTTYVLTVTDTDNSHTATDEVLITVTPGSCSDGVQNGDETAKDCGGPRPWFNEIHVDNAGTDVGEGVEIAGPSGIVLTGWSVVHYNSSGNVARTLPIDGALSTSPSGIGVIWIAFPVNGLINSGPAGVALVDPKGTVVQFLSWGGVVTAAAGPANGMTSVALPTSEPGTTPVGTSMQLQGTGRRYSDFTWARYIQATEGKVNEGQTFVEGCKRCLANEACSLDIDCTSGICTAGVCEEAPLVANAGGPYNFRSGDTITLVGTATGYSGQIRCDWTHATLPAITDDCNPSITPSESTTWTLTVTATATNETSTATAIVLQVSDLIANAGPDQKVLNGVAVKLTGAAFNAVGGYSCKWTNDKDSSFSLDSCIGEDPNPQDGAIYTLTVTDGSGKIASDTFTIAISLPIAKTKTVCQDITSGQSITLDGTWLGVTQCPNGNADCGAGTCVNGQCVACKWELVDGTEVATTCSVTVNPARTTTYRLVVTDTKTGNSDSDTTTVYVTDKYADLCSWATIQMLDDGSVAPFYSCDPSGDFTTQQVNAAPSIVLSDLVLENVKLSGTIEVQTSSDDDFIGVIWGWQNPQKFYLLSWKKGTQYGYTDYGFAGIGIAKMDGTGSTTIISGTPATLEYVYPPQTFWATHNATGIDSGMRFLIESIGPGGTSVGWVANTPYRFDIYYTSAQTKVVITEISTNTVVLDTVIADASFPKGQFAFFTNSQSNVRFSAFALECLESFGADAGSDVTINQGETTTLQASVDAKAVQPIQCFWSVGPTVFANTCSVDVKPDATTTYTLTVVDAFKRKRTATVKVNVTTP